MIYPKPQKTKLSGEMLFHGVPEIFTSGYLSEYALDFLERELPKKRTDELNVNINYADDYKTTYCEKTRKISDEKYFINIDNNKLCEITVSSKRGLFRALCTLVKLIDEKSLKAGLIEDYPLFSMRGYIEGFYGKVWEHKTRKSVMSLMARHGMNTFFYAPKDDEYHRPKWREPYPEKELNDLRELFLFSLENEIDFHYCIAPGLSMRYTSEDDFSILIKKIRSLYDIGIRRFGLLLDDIPEKLQYKEDIAKYGETVNAHIDLVNRVFAELKKLDKSIELTMCPLQYHGKGDEYFISKLGRGLESEINIFWTGNNICSQELASLEAVRFIESTRHKPLYWDNYPVNDAEMFNEMHLGPIEGREADLYRYSKGLISNVMEYAECSKIPLLTIADYLWNPEQYNKDESYEYALNTVLGDKAELFKYFCDHLQVSCLTKRSSVFLSDTLSKASFLLNAGKQLEAFAVLTDYLDNASVCEIMLKDMTNPLFKELKRWSLKYGKCCEILKLTLELICSGDEETKKELFERAEQYDKDATLLTGFCLREAVQQAIEM